MRAVVFDKSRSAAPVLRALAFTACVPYLALKIAWVCGKAGFRGWRGRVRRVACSEPRL
jgi:hypothetical protein